jgi:thiamine pyrophosphate-dependent acetolactate synthase large subunit-like protein
MLEWLFDSERPSIVTGEGITYDDAQEELREFIALTGIPCHCRRNSRGAISEYDPLNCYGRARGYVMRKCDKGVLMGLRCGGLEWFGYPPFFGTQAIYGQIQTHPDNTVLSLPTEHELIGNMKLTLKLMTECAKDMGIKKPPEKWAGWRKEVADKKDEYHQRTIERTDKQKGVEPLHPDILGRLTAEFLREELDDEYYSIIDGFTAATYYSDWIKVKDQFRPGLQCCHQGRPAHHRGHG